jgi:hypothetical protein
MERAKWIERRFDFNLPEGWMTNVLERLHGAIVRLDNLTHDLGDAAATERPGGKWSIREHMGHLCDLEELHEGRIRDFMGREPVLRAADMENIKTKMANHNAIPVVEHLAYFSNKRNAFINSLSALDDATQAFVSMHPRLQIPMRPVDMACFTAEHDDHHLATIRLIRQGRGF